PGCGRAAGRARAAATRQGFRVESPCWTPTPLFRMPIVRHRSTPARPVGRKRSPMDRPADLGRLKTSEWNLVLELAERFDQAWQDAESVDLAAFLPPPEDPLRPAALQELIKTELEIRWRRGQRPLLEEYAGRFPELGGPANLSPRLLYEEFRVRHLF